MTTESDEQLRRELREALAPMTDNLMLEGVTVRAIHSCDYAEDGKTFMVMVDLEDGTTAVASFCPGLPVTYVRV